MVIYMDLLHAIQASVFENLHLRGKCARQLAERIDSGLLLLAGVGLSKPGGRRQSRIVDRDHLNSEHCFSLVARRDALNHGDGLR